MKVNSIKNVENPTLTTEFKTRLASSLNQNEVKALILTMPGCIHCEHLKPVLKKVYKTLKKYTTSNGREIYDLEHEIFTTLEVDSTIKDAVSGYPTILIIKNKTALPYTGPRTYEALLKFFINMLHLKPIKPIKSIKSIKSINATKKRVTLKKKSKSLKKVKRSRSV